MGPWRQRLGRGGTSREHTAGRDEEWVPPRAWGRTSSPRNCGGMCFCCSVTWFVIFQGSHSKLHQGLMRFGGSPGTRTHYDGTLSISALGSPLRGTDRASLDTHSHHNQEMQGLPDTLGGAGFPALSWPRRPHLPTLQGWRRAPCGHRRGRHEWCGTGSAFAATLTRSIGPQIRKHLTLPPLPGQPSRSFSLGCGEHLPCA